MTDQTVPATFAGAADTAAPGPGPGLTPLPAATTPTMTAAGSGATSTPLTLSAVAARIQRPRLSVTLYLDAELAQQIDDAREALERAVEYDKTTNEPDTAPAIAQHLRDLEDAAEGAQAVFIDRKSVV